MNYYLKELTDEKCKHCEFLQRIFPLSASKYTRREYWIYTEIFVYLHGADVCDGRDAEYMPGDKTEIRS